MNIILILRFLVMIGIAVGVCMSFVYIRDKSLVKKSLITMRERINASGESRKVSEKNVYQMYGRYERKGLLNHIDDNLRYSGVQMKHSWLTTEAYLVMSTVILTAFFLLVSVVGGGMAYGMVCVSALVLAAELYFNSQRRGRYNGIEEELLPFLNSIDAYAGATDDLISIFEKSVPVLNGPLKEAVYSAVLQSKQTGNCSEVLRNLENNIEHPFFKKLVRNLEMSSRHSANYKDIITECRFQLDEATSNAKKLEKIYKDGKLDIILVVICGMACVVLALMGILDYAVKDFFIGMWSTVPGKIIIMLCAASLLISFYIAFVSSQKRGGIMRAFIQNYYDYIMQGVIILLCLLAAAFIMVYMSGAVKDAYKRAHEQLVNAMKRSTGKNIFSYNYQAKRLNNLGVTYYSHGRITPVVYLIYKILILVTGLAVAIMSDPLMGIILAVSGYMLPDMFMELRNKEDNEKMLGSIMDIYDVMLLQINAGGYITQVLVDAYRVTTHPRLKAALMELTGDILTTNDLVLSMQVFEDKFDNENIHNLTVLVRQLSETGSASGLLSDIKKRLNILQESYNSSERTRVNRLIAVCTAAIAFAAIAVLGYAFVTGIADSAKLLL